MLRVTRGPLGVAFGPLFKKHCPTLIILAQIKFCQFSLSHFVILSQTIVWQSGDSSMLWFVQAYLVLIGFKSTIFMFHTAACRISSFHLVFITDESIQIETLAELIHDCCVLVFYICSVSPLSSVHSTSCHLRRLGRRPFICYFAPCVRTQVWCCVHALVQMGAQIVR